MPRIKLGRASRAPDETHVTPGRPDRLGPAPGARKAPATRHPNRPGWGRRPSGVAPERRAVPALRGTQRGRPSWLSKLAPARGPAGPPPAPAPPSSPSPTRRAASPRPPRSPRSGAAFAEQGKRVLLVDLDAQACLTFSLGVDPDDGRDLASTRCCSARPSAADAVIACEDGVDLVPSVHRPGRRRGPAAARARAASTSCASALEAVAHAYDVVLLDCSPSPRRAHPQRADGRARA